MPVAVPMAVPIVFAVAMPVVTFTGKLDPEPKSLPFAASPACPPQRGCCYEM
jgi:hypothetical protein